MPLVCPSILGRGPIYDPTRGMCPGFPCCSFKALVFPLPTNALTVSHPVYACIPMRALQTSMPTVAATFMMSTSLVRVLVPHFWNNGTWDNGTTEAELPGSCSATVTFFCNVVAKVALLVFLSNPSGVDRAQGNGPRG